MNGVLKTARSVCSLNDVLNIWSKNVSVSPYMHPACHCGQGLSGWHPHTPYCNGRRLRLVAIHQTCPLLLQPVVSKMVTSLPYNGLLTEHVFPHVQVYSGWLHFGWQMIGGKMVELKVHSGRRYAQAQLLRSWSSFPSWAKEYAFVTASVKEELV